MKEEKEIKLDWGDTGKMSGGFVLLQLAMVYLKLDDDSVGSWVMVLFPLWIHAAAFVFMIGCKMVAHFISQKHHSIAPPNDLKSNTDP